MNDLLNFILLLISQFAGGTGQMENNLVRFSIPAITYGALLLVAWSRQRESHPQREKLLVWGFGLGAASATIMFIFAAVQILNLIERETAYPILVPVERALSIASVVVVAGAFLRYILDDARLARTYIQVGISIAFINLMFALWQWPLQLAVLREEQFHRSWISWLFQASASVMIVTAIILVRRKSGWLANVVTVALTFFLLGELLFITNYLTDKVYNRTICPIGNLFSILATPLLGYVYLREMSIERKQAQKALDDYRLHLEELVSERTAELSSVNDQLIDEIAERKKAEEALTQLSHQYELILESAGEGICGINDRGRFVFVNSAAARMLGYEANELIGQHCRILWHNNETKDAFLPESEIPIYKGYANGIPSRGDDQVFWRKDHSGFPASYVNTPTYENHILTGSVLVFKDISERKQAEIEITRRNANLAAQNAIASALSRSLDLEIILNTALEAVLSIVNMDAGLIFLWDSTADELTLQCHHGSVLQNPHGASLQEWDCCKMISREAMKNFGVLVKAVSECPAAGESSLIVREGLQTLVSIPLVSNNKALGALTLASRKTASIPQHELELLGIIGQQIGMAVENANLYRTAERVAEELTLLHQISTVLASTLNSEKIYEQIVVQSVKLLNCDLVWILDWDHETQSVKVLASHGMTEAENKLLKNRQETVDYLRELIARREAIMIGDAQTDARIPDFLKKALDLRAIFCVPIQSMDESFGLLFLMDRRTAQRWRYEQIVLVEAFVNRAAVALMNARLHKQLEWAAALEERQRIAADMHDGLGQTVSLLGLQIDNAMELISSGAEQQAVTELKMTRETVRQVAVEVRRSIASLQRTPQPLRSIQELLLELPEKTPRADSPSIQFDFKLTDPLFLPQEQGNQVMFVMQEALLNAQRHAHARQITLTLDAQEHAIRISVEDDGVGFEQGAWWETSQNHFGLGIMHSRAARIGADLQIDSVPGHGTRVTLILPQGNGKYFDRFSHTPLSQNSLRQGMPQ
ncbi:MAG: GAF domain-containing protein [Chloroflexota bacterium]